MMRILPLMLVLALGACDSLDTSPGSSGIMNRELPSPR
jgi:hypothetical protein